MRVRSSTVSGVVLARTLARSSLTEILAVGVSSARTRPARGERARPRANPQQGMRTTVMNNLGSEPRVGTVAGGHEPKTPTFPPPFSNTIQAAIQGFPAPAHRFLRTASKCDESFF